MCQTFSKLLGLSCVWETPRPQRKGSEGDRRQSQPGANGAHSQGLHSLVSGQAKMQCMRPPLCGSIIPPTFHPCTHTYSPHTYIYIHRHTHNTCIHKPIYPSAYHPPTHPHLFSRYYVLNSLLRSRVENSNKKQTRPRQAYCLEFQVLGQECGYCGTQEQRDLKQQRSQMGLRLPEGASCELCWRQHLLELPSWNSR